MSAYNPLTTPVDFITLSSKPSPGTGVLIGLGSPREWDEVKVGGMSGATLRFMGRKLAKFSFQITLITDADWEAWEAFRPLVERPPYGKKPQSHDIGHPFCTMHDIKSVVVENWTGPVMGDKGEGVITIDLVEYRVLKVSYAKPTDSAPTPKVTDPFDLENEGLYEQYRYRVGL